MLLPSLRATNRLRGYCLLPSARMTSSIPEKALAKGTECPPLTKDLLRIYSMRFCPFAQRTRMVLVHKNIPHETVNVNLRFKPNWLWERNPFGLVPVLEINDKVVYESSVCDDFLDEVYPENKLTSADPYERAQQKMLMTHYGEMISLFYQTLRRMDEEKREDILAQVNKLMRRFEGVLKDKFFGGERLGMIDVHIWPWFERFPVVEKLLDCELTPKETFPKLNRWMENMFQTDAVKATMYHPSLHEEFILSLKNKKPNYDIGLDQSKL